MIRYMGSQVLPICKGEWKDPDLLDIKVSKILSLYRESYIKVIDNDEVKIIRVRDLPSYNYTIRWLLSEANYGNITLVYTDRIPNHRLEEARYSSVYQAGYTVSAFDSNRGNNIRACHKKFQDVRISSNLRSVRTDIASTSCLFSINGLLFNHRLSGDSIVIENGGLSLSDRQKAHVGLISFYKMGGIQTNPLTLTTDQGRANLSDIIFIESPKQEGKSVFLVFGGFIIPEKKGVFYRIDSEKMALRLGGIPHIERTLTMLNSINVDHLDILANVEKSHSCKRDYYYSDSFLMSLLMSSLSFIVTVNVPILAFETNTVRTGRIPGLIVQDREPVKPIVADCGRILEHWKTEVDRFWHINAIDTHYREYVLESDMLNSGGSASETLKSKLVHHRAKIAFLSIIGYR